MIDLKSKTEESKFNLKHKKAYVIFRAHANGPCLFYLTHNKLNCLDSVMQKNIKDYFDQYGVLVQKNLDGSYDGGDSCQRTFTYCFFKFFLNDNRDFDKKLTQECFTTFKFWSSEPVRHPDTKYWWGLPKTLSRDQLIPVIAAISAFGLHEEMEFLFLEMIARLGACWNYKKIGQIDGPQKLLPDFIGPVTWSMFLRYKVIFTNRFFVPLYYALISFCDLFLILEVIVRIIKGYANPDDVSDDINLTVVLMNNFRFETVFSHIASWMYAVLRTQACNAQKGENGVISAWRWYFNEPEAPPLDDMLVSVLNRMSLV